MLEKKRQAEGEWPPTGEHQDDVAPSKKARHMITNENGHGATKESLHSRLDGGASEVTSDFPCLWRHGQTSL